MQKKHTLLASGVGIFIGIIIALCMQTQAGLPLSDSQGQAIPSLAPMLKRTNIAVVNISVSQTQTARNPLLDDPFFRQFFNVPDNYKPQQRETESAGSGVIIDADEGLVITNHHVIKNANKITVSLSDGRNIDAKLIGSDPEVDIAVLKIEAKNLHSIPVADSDKLNVGDFAVAIGNPFGLGQTVTTGIVSALGRSGLGIQGYENFIQTDASINPGNSGGALVNLRGELIGINTAIIAPTGGNVGIGFAIPTNMAKYSMEQIVKYGKVTRGQLGVYIQELDSDLAQAFGVSKNLKGVVITRVANGSPAQSAGIKDGDIITHVNNKAVTSAAQLRNTVGIKRPGDKLDMRLVRNGKTVNIPVTISQHAFDQNASSGSSSQAPSSSVNAIIEGTQLENAQGGVLVAQVQRDSQAARSGLRPKDLIISANRQRVNNVDDLAKAINQNSARVLLQVQRGGSNLFLIYRR